MIGKLFLKNSLSFNLPTFANLTIKQSTVHYQKANLSIRNMYQKLIDKYMITKYLAFNFSTLKSIGRSSLANQASHKLNESKLEDWQYSKLIS